MLLGRYLGIALLALIALAISASYGFFQLFSHFMPYDDEGLFLHARQLYLQGHDFYTEIFWPYGVAWLALPEIAQGWLDITLSHSSVRITTLLQWIILAGLAGLLVQRLTRSFALAIGSYLAVFVYTDSLANEPGHPQLLIAIIGIITILAAPRDWRQYGRWMLVAVLLGLIFNLKLNAGLFSLIAVGMVYAAHSPWFGRSLSLLIVAGAASGSFLLMWPLLSSAGSKGFATLVAGGSVALAVVLVQSSRPVEKTVWLRGLIRMAAAFLLLNLMLFSGAALIGITPGAVFSNLVSYIESQASFYHFFRQYLGCILSWPCCRHLLRWASVLSRAHPGVTRCCSACVLACSPPR